MKTADQSTAGYKVYKNLPEISLKYAFGCSNGCPNIYTNKQGCLGDLNSKIYVIKLIVPKEKMNPQLHAAIENDSSIRSSIQKDRATAIIWVTSDGINGKKGSVLALLDKKIISLHTRTWSVETDPKSDFKWT